MPGLQSSDDIQYCMRMPVCLVSIFRIRLWVVPFLFLLLVCGLGAPPCFCRQGETDGAKEDRAKTYYERFETLVEDIRGLGYPDLNIFTVAVTGSNGRLSFLNQVCVCRVRLSPIRFNVLVCKLSVLCVPDC